MADDKDQLNDEYEFSELDNISSEEENEEESISKPATSLQTPTNIRRNALIAIGVILGLMLGYKIVGYFFMRKSAVTSSPPPVALTSPVQKTIPKPQTAVQEPSLISTAPPAPTVVAEGRLPTDKIFQELANLGNNQREIRMGIDPLSGQLHSINNNISGLSDKLSELTQAISTLSSKIEEQTTRIESLIVKSRPRNISRNNRVSRPIPEYAIQAVIPGRAWLISKNGSTITVNIGSRIPGYGVVKLIDSRQGKIFTSSGRIIIFGQRDS